MKYPILVIAAMLTLAFPSCRYSPQTGQETNNTESQETTEQSMPEESQKDDSAQNNQEMHAIQIVVGDETFSARLYKNATTKSLLKKFPITLDMDELNGNEKYYYLSDSLPTDAAKPSTIHAGDLMLYGSDCLVLFYESFSTSYSYTSLGYIDNPEGLSDALGEESVKVTFQFPK
ncbi:cyclophilin-like fold protein [Anaerolentibacter hominis]|uniref:cyclophilin-like fold protein n=1 Tax=Anaerolentibacter hominis TaxID=3079009 RepID=UPI0031B89009